MRATSITQRLLLLVALAIALAGLIPTAADAYAGTATGVTDLAAGNLGFCYVRAEGRVDCWSPSEPGAPSGPGTKPVPGVGGVARFTGAITVTSDGTGYCALMTGGAVDCWSPAAPNPAPVPGVGGTGALTGVAKLSSDLAGSYCALLGSGSVACWGENAAGELGDGTAEASAVPTMVLGPGKAGTLSGATAVYGGHRSYCALLGGGTVDCWGSDAHEELGGPAPETCGSLACATYPLAVPGLGGSGTLSGVKALAKGDTPSAGSMCALLESGGVDCWGAGSGAAASGAPEAVLGGGVTSVAGDAPESQGPYCAVLASTKVDCWHPHEAPKAIPAVEEEGRGELSEVRAVTGRGETTCATLTKGRVACWENKERLPRILPGLGNKGIFSGVNILLSNGSLYCALMNAGGVDCFGNPLAGESWPVQLEAAAGPACSGAAIEGAGSELQVPAEWLWAAGFAAICGPGKIAYGASPTAELHSIFAGGTVGGTAFLGTDNPGEGNLVIPVAQTAITAFVDPPPGCEVEEITNKQLESVFRGNIKNWGKIETAFGAGCAGVPITRVAMSERTEITRQFDQYLALANAAGLACTEGEKTWSELAITGTSGGEPVTTWPENGAGGCAAGQLSALTKVGGGGRGVVEAVDATPGSIGYAALPVVEAARTGATATLRLQNNGLVKLANATFAAPATEADKSANCAAATYQRRNEFGNPSFSMVSGANPNIGGEAYPFCALTYVVSNRHYSSIGLSEAAEVTAYDYLAEYVLTGPAQQLLRNGHQFYYSLPRTSRSTTNVLGPAEAAAAEIGY